MELDFSKEIFSKQEIIAFLEAEQDRLHMIRHNASHEKIKAANYAAEQEIGYLIDLFSRQS